MKHIYLLEGSDVINPNDFMRPLARSADYDPCSEGWHDTNAYGGGPLDHLKWARVYMILGSIWWGSKYQDYTNFGTIHRPYEYARGEIPKEHQLTGEKWDAFHPLYGRKVTAMWDTIKDKKFDKGKYKDYTLERVLKIDAQYLEWARAEWNSPLMDSYRKYHEMLLRVRFVSDAEKYLTFPETDNIISVLNI